MCGAALPSLVWQPTFLLQPRPMLRNTDNEGRVPKNKPNWPILRNTDNKGRVPKKQNKPAHVEKYR